MSHFTYRIVSMAVLAPTSTLVDSFTPSDWLKFLMLLIHLTILLTTGGHGSQGEALLLNA